MLVSLVVARREEVWPEATDERLARVVRYHGERQGLAVVDDLKHQRADGVHATREDRIGFRVGILN